MTDLDKEFKRIRRRLLEINSTEFDEMLDKCGIDVINPSKESDYVKTTEVDFMEGLGK